MPNEDKNKSPKYKIVKNENYLTLFIGGEETGDPQREMTDNRSIEVLVELLTQKENTQLKVDALRELKTEKGKELLLKAIAVSKDPEKTRVLAAACWEAGHDYSKYVSFFAQLAILGDLYISLEVLTIMEDMQGPFDEKILRESIFKLEAAMKTVSPEKSQILSDILLTIKRFES